LTFWCAEPIWKGQACYIIGGGPSLLTQNLTLLKGQNVIVINSSYLAFADAQFLVFSDMRWWCHHLRAKAMVDFKGRVISTSSQASGLQVVRMKRKTSVGLATERDTLMVKNTTLTGAINLAVHCGATKLVLLGIDQKAAADGRVHHHAPHPWKPTADCWKRQQFDMPKIAEDLTVRNIECVNASPGSALALWPIVKLEDHVAAADIARVA
jgi:hypothetical protein